MRNADKVVVSVSFEEDAGEEPRGNAAGLRPILSQRESRLAVVSITKRLRIIARHDGEVLRILVRGGSPRQLQARVDGDDVDAERELLRVSRGLLLRRLLHLVTATGANLEDRRPAGLALCGLELEQDVCLLDARAPVGVELELEDEERGVFVRRRAHLAVDDGLCVADCGEGVPLAQSTMADGHPLALQLAREVADVKVCLWVGMLDDNAGKAVAVL